MMHPTEPLVDIGLLNLAAAASLARNAILQALDPRLLREHPFHAAARLLRHISALEDALRDYDRAGTHDAADLPF